MAVRKKLQHSPRALPRKNKKSKNKKTLRSDNNDRQQQQQQHEAAETKMKRFLLTQEVKFARLLANVDKKIRDRTLKRLQKWLTIRSQSSYEFTKLDFMTVWKGLFYSMWMCPGLLAQEELAELISKIVHCFDKEKTVVLYTTCALRTLAAEWFGLDHYSVDKFQMLIRRVVRQTFMACKEKSWDLKLVKEISQIFEKLFVEPERNSMGFNFHVTEIYLEELAKISNGHLPEDVIVELIRPFVVYLVTTRDEREIKSIAKHIFRYLIFQSNEGLDYTEKFKAWRASGFPCIHVDDMQQVDISNEEENFTNEDEQLSEIETQNEAEKLLDPRAGRVDVDLPQIPFDAAQIVQLLSQYKFHPTLMSRSRKQLNKLLEQFKELSEGRMPIGIKRVRKPNCQRADMDSRKAARRLLRFEKNLSSDKVNRKRKRIERPQNEDISDTKKTVDSQSKSSDTIVSIKSNSQTVDADVVPIKKQKKSKVTCEKRGDKREIAEEKLETKHLSKKNNVTNNEAKNIKSKRTNETLTTDKGMKRKAKKVAFSKQVSDNLNSCTSSAPISQNVISPKKTYNKTVVKRKKTSANENVHNCQATQSKKKLTNRMSEQSSAKNLEGKKKVKIALHRNTMQHTSEYVRRVRQSPAIPYNANKKPLPSVLKTNLIPSPINPFYRKGLRT